MQAITNVQTGAYEGVVTLADGSQKTLAEYVKELNNTIVPAKDAVVNALHINEGSASASQALATFLYSGGTPPAKVLFVPTLESLGYASADYKMQAVVIANVRTNNPNAPAELRLVDAAGDAVSGSTVAATITNDTVDQVVTSAAVDITPGTAYAIDIRLITADGGTTTVTLQSKNLLVQVVKK